MHTETVNMKNGREGRKRAGDEINEDHEKKDGKN